MRSILRFLLVPVILGITAVGSLAFEAPALKGRVNDYAELLTPMQRNTLEDALRALEQKTTAQVAILTVKDLGEAKDPVVLSQKVFETWKLGQKDKNNGLLIFYTATEDRFRLHTGYGMEVIIPDGAAGTIMREHFRRWAPQKKEPKDFYKAFTTTVEAVSKRIEAAHDAAQQAPPPASGTIGLNLWHLILTVGVFVLAVFAGRASASPGFSAMVGGLGEGGVALFFYSMPLAVVAGVVGAGLAAAVAAMLVSSQRSAVMRPVYEGRAPASRAPQRSSGRSRPAAAASKPQRTARREEPYRRRQDDDFPVVAPVDYGSSSRSSSSDDSFSSSSGGFSGGGGDSGGGGAGD